MRFSADCWSGSMPYSAMALLCISFANLLLSPPGTFASSHWLTVRRSSSMPAGVLLEYVWG